MPEVVSVVVVPELPGGGGHANVPLLGLASGEDVGLVDDMVVFTPGSIHWALLGPPTTVAVGVLRPLLREDVSYDLCVVATDDLGQAGHGPVAELDCVPVKDTMEGVVDGKAGVEDVQKPLTDLGFQAHAEWWVEPHHLPLSLPPPRVGCHLLRLVDQLLRVPGPPQRLLLWAFGCVEDFLGG